MKNGRNKEVIKPLKGLGTSSFENNSAKLFACYFSPKN